MGSYKQHSRASKGLPVCLVLTHGLSSDCASGRPTGTIFGTSLAPSSLDSSHSSHSHHQVHTSSATLAPSVVDRCTQSSLGSPTDGTTVSNAIDDVNSLSDSGSSLYAKTESNYSQKDPESPVSSDAMNEVRWD